MTLCAYCGKARAVNVDHVVPKSLLRKTYGKLTPKAKVLPLALRETVPACFRCNNLKGTRRLVPESWAGRIDHLNAVFPGTPWRVWDGNTKSPAYRETNLAPSVVVGLATLNNPEPAGAD